MTYKEIIIDGVDISKCKHYDEVFNYCDQSYLGEGGLLKNTKNPKRCECSPNCYYKQLKRKEQECKELETMVAAAEEAPICFHCSEELCIRQERDKYKQALDELKKSIKHIEHNRKQKADKLMRIEKLITACSTGYIDEFVQELLVILHEPEKK